MDQINLTLTDTQVKNLLAIVEAQTENLRTMRDASHSGVDQVLFNSAVIDCEMLTEALREQVPVELHPEPLFPEAPEA